MRNPTSTEIDELVECWCGDEWPLAGDAEERRGAIEHNLWVKQHKKELAGRYRSDPDYFWESFACYHTGGPDEHPEEYHALLKKHA